MLNNLLIYRVALFNALNFVFLGVFYQLGWLETVFLADVSMISWLIAQMFLVTLGYTFFQTFKISRAMNIIKSSKNIWLDIADVKKRLIKIKFIEKAAEWMTYLGLIGTVVGFIIAFQSIDMSLIGDAQGVQQIAGALVTGMGVALVTTLVGAVAGLWTDMNYRMIRTVAELSASEVDGF